MLNELSAYLQVRGEMLSHSKIRKSLTFASTFGFMLEYVLGSEIAKAKPIRILSRLRQGVSMDPSLRVLRGSA